MNNYVEISSKTSNGGKRKIKMVLLEIYDEPNKTNKNGLHWTEENIYNNIDSLNGIPICAEFIDDDKEVPYGHGFTGLSKENEPLFENSLVVGSIRNGYINTIVIGGESKKVLIGEGYIYHQRFPNFTEWLENGLKENKVWSSVEIMGKDEYGKKIVYEEAEYSKEFRTPKIFNFSGTSILLQRVEQADNTALILQLNQKQNKEDSTMEKETLNAFVADIKQSIVEVCAKNTEYETKIAELNSLIEAKDKEISELNSCKTEQEAEIKSLKKVVSDNEAILNSCKSELDACKKENCIKELNSKLVDYSAEQKEFAKKTIDKFMENPLECGIEINSIISEINAKSYEKIIAEQKTKEKDLSLIDIFGGVDSIDTNTDDFGF